MRVAYGGYLEGTLPPGILVVVGVVGLMPDSVMEIASQRLKELALEVAMALAMALALAVAITSSNFSRVKYGLRPAAQSG